MRAFLLIVFLCLFFSVAGWGQISQGGFPKVISELKSAGVSVVEMPSINYETLKKSAVQTQLTENRLKPFKFAHAFEVNFTPSNSGEWFTSVDGIRCWRLKIRSKGAKSINLIFDNFKLPENSRLFIFNENENHVLGAFTNANNKASGKFAVSPVVGDEITVQYETLSKDASKDHFEIIRVNHDFIGIMKSNDRRPLGISGECNIDVNCEIGSDWNEVKNSVCRLIVDGIELCTGALINNTAEDQKPYIISAAHCYDKWEYAETSVYVFNYESPYCAALDGDPYHSVSGALMKAQFDSLDFALAELSTVPPPEFRPYYAGWDHSSDIPVSTVSIHHPQGDIKKIAFDYDSPGISDFNSHYIKNAFLKIDRWDFGVTEVGSSGGPLFNNDKNLIGTLTGGVATCSNPVRDYFERLSLSWNYKPDSTKQLKCWLDPIKSGVSSLSGKQFYEGADLCNAYTNLTDEDKHGNISIINSGQSSGYWGGTNSVGITEFMERFSIYGNEQLSGVSIGVGKIIDSPGGVDSEITIKVYNGNELPETLIYSDKVKIKDLAEDAMNFIGFNEIVEPSESFFVGFELSNMQPLDSFVVYQSLRPAYDENFFYFKKDGLWLDFKNSNPADNAMSNVFELLACNIDDPITDTPLVNNPLEIWVFPNPTNSYFTVESATEIFNKDFSVVNLLGQNVDVQFTKIHQRKIRIDLTGNVPGIYFVRFNNTEGIVSRKVSFVPW